MISHVVRGRKSGSGLAGGRVSSGDECTVSLKMVGLKVSVEGLKGNGCAPVKWRVSDVGGIIPFLEKG